MKASYWEINSYLSSVDLTIIGGGLTGLLSAYHYIHQYPSGKVRILERGPIPFGASTRNAGFACFGSPSEILEDLSVEGLDATKQRLAWRIDGLRFYQELFPSSLFDYSPVGGYEIFRKEDSNKFESISERIPEINNLLRTFFSKDVFSIDSHLSLSGMAIHEKGFYNSEEGSLHPGKLCLALEKLLKEKGVDIRCGVSVREIEESNAKVLLIDDQGWTWPSEKCIVATNGLTKTLLPEYNIEPARGQVILTHPINGLRLSGTYHLDEGYYYFRNVEDRVLLGGGRHREVENERTSNRNTTRSIENHLQAIMRQIVLPNQEFSIDHSWAGTMSFGADNEKTPELKRLSDRIVLAARLGGMGVAMAPSLAKIAVELIRE